MPSPEQGTTLIQEFVAIADSDSAHKPLFSLNQQIASSPKKEGDTKRWLYVRLKLMLE
jgi:hypothetical protein